MRRKNLPRYHSFCVNDTTQAPTRKTRCAVHLNAVGRGGLLSRRGEFCSSDFTVPAPKGYAVPSATQFHQPCALCKVSTLCFFIIAFQVILAYFIWFVKGFGGKSIGITEFLATSSTGERGASCLAKGRKPKFKQLLLQPRTASRARCTAFYATSCYAARSGQETRQDVPSWISPALPRYKDNDEIDINGFHAMLQLLPPRAAGEESKIVFVDNSAEPRCVARDKKGAPKCSF